MNNQFDWSITDQMKSKFWGNVDFCIEKLENNISNLNHVQDNVLKNKKFIAHYLKHYGLDADTQWLVTAEVQEFFLAHPKNPLFENYYDMLYTYEQQKKYNKSNPQYRMSSSELARELTVEMNFKDFLQKAPPVKRLKYMTRSDILSLSQEEFDTIIKGTTDWRNYPVKKFVNKNNLLKLAQTLIDQDVLDYNFFDKYKEVLSQISAEDKIKFVIKNFSERHGFNDEIKIDYPGFEVMSKYPQLIEYDQKYSSMMSKEPEDIFKFVRDKKIEDSYKTSLLGLLPNIFFKKHLDTSEKVDLVLSYIDLQDLYETKRPEHWYTPKAMIDYLAQASHIHDCMEKKVSAFVKVLPNAIKAIQNSTQAYEFLPDEFQKNTTIVEKMLAENNFDLNIYDDAVACEAAFNYVIEKNPRKITEFLKKVKEPVWHDIKFLRSAMKELDSGAIRIKNLPLKIQTYLTCFPTPESYLEFINIQFEKNQISQEVVSKKTARIHKI